MFIVRVAMAEHKIAGKPRIELKWGDGRLQTLQLPEPGRTVELPPFGTPTEKFKLNIAYWLDQTRVGVVLGAVRDKDIFTIFASPHQEPNWQQSGVLYVGTMFHGDGLKEPCEVKCEGSAEIDECCVTCKSGNVIVETCC